MPEQINPYARSDLEQVAQEHFKRFVGTIYRLVVEQQRRFDLLVGAGNSGVGMVKCTQLIYDHLQIQVPPTLVLPIYRHWPKDARTEENLFDNAVLLPEVKRQLGGPGSLRKILFVDDEIGGGTALRAVVNLLQLARPNQSGDMAVTVVAENHGFNADIKIAGISIQFFPYAEEIKGLNNLVSYGIPYAIERPITRLYNDKQIGSVERFNLLLGEPVKKMENSQPCFSVEREELKRRIKDFSGLQGRFEKHIRQLIASAIAQL